jgi:peptidoglycan/LPS O-acetylase OafA/YrhL
MSDSPSRPKADRLPALDALRAIGAIWVLTAHASFDTGFGLSGTWGAFFVRGDIGVAVFFVLSGFLLFRPFAYASATGAKRPGVRYFFWRRAVRILPAYWVMVIVALLALPNPGGTPPREWWRYLTLTQIYTFDGLRLGLTQTWSLVTEVAFYLVLPLLAWLLLRRNWRPVRTVVVTCALGLGSTMAWLVLMAVGPLSTGHQAPWLPSFGIWFAAGIAFAVIHVARQTGTGPARWRVLDEIASSPGTCWAAVLALLAIVSTPIAGPYGATATTAAEFGVKLWLSLAIAVFILIPAAFGPRTRYQVALTGPIPHWLGAVSYGIFLWHPLVLELLFRSQHRAHFTGGMVGMYLGTLAGAVAIASVSFYLMEQPLLRWSARWPRRRDRGGEPQRGDGKKSRRLRPQIVVPVQGGHGEPSGNGNEGDRQPRFQPA